MVLFPGVLKDLAVGREDEICIERVMRKAGVQVDAVRLVGDAQREGAAS